MATTQNTYTGDGSTVLYNFTFPYIDESDVYVSLDGTATTAYSYANATTIQFTTAPASGVAIRIYRATDSADTKAAFFAGSAIRSKDLNDNFTQSLYIAQESENIADAAKVSSEAATTLANTANTNSTAAAASAATATQQATASAASAASALAASQQASTDAASAQASATAAAASSVTAASEASQAATDSATAISTANAASALATTADGNATAALNNSRQSNGQGGFDSAISIANTAQSTANTANTNASSAVTTANSASATATAASNAVAAAAFYSPYAALANLPSSPSNGDRAEIENSTGVESSSAVDGVPSGFVGATDLTVRLQYNGTSSKWDWQNYFASDPDNRYFTQASGNANTTSISTNTTAIATKMPLAGGTFSGAVNFDDDVVLRGDTTNGSGKLTLNCENNSHGVVLQGPPHSAAASYTVKLPDSIPSGTTTLATVTDTSANIPSGTTAQRPGTAVAGMFRFNSTDSKFEGYDGSAWGEIGGGIITIDAGNFTSGASLVSTSTEIDGGSF